MLLDNNRMLEMKNRLAALPVLKERLRKLDARINEAQEEIAALLKKYEAESLDVDQIKKESLFATVLKLIGKYDGRVEREVREMLEAKSAYDAAVNRVNELIEEKRELNPRIAELIRDECVFENELKRREELLKSRLTGDASQSFKMLEAEQEQLMEQIIETDEAVKAAYRAKNTAAGAIEHLDDAEGWATYDVWFKSGIISHMAKYDHIDNAKTGFDRLNSQLRDLRNELEDINLSCEFQPVGIDSTTRAIDFWFDNIFTDLDVREKIRGDRDRIRTIYGRLHRLIDRLEQNKSALDKKINDIEKRKADLVISFNG